jgi:hypothetical protein
MVCRGNIQIIRIIVSNMVIFFNRPVVEGTRSGDNPPRTFIHGYLKPEITTV